MSIWSISAMQYQAHLMAIFIGLIPVWWPGTANNKITYFCVINLSLIEK